MASNANSAKGNLRIAREKTAMFAWKEEKYTEVISGNGLMESAEKLDVLAGTYRPDQLTRRRRTAS